MEQFLDNIRSGSGAGTKLENYEDLHRWSVDHREEFWAELWRFLEIRSSGSYEAVYQSSLEVGDEEDTRPELVRGRWFPGVKLNYAENTVECNADGDKEALVFRDESQDTRVSWTFGRLKEEVLRVATGLRALGLQEGDVVSAVMPNIPETIIVALGTIAIGCIWASCSPDFGTAAVVDRFGQIRPTTLVVTNRYRYKGKWYCTEQKSIDVVRKLPTVLYTVFCDYPAPNMNEGWTEESKRLLPGAIHFRELGSPDCHLFPFQYAMVEVDHPVFIMFSSGTTGMPKCLVQGFGVFLNQRKEHVLHLDVNKETKMMFYTTCGWMMWNWMIPVLASGATLVLYDGAAIPDNPLYLWTLAESEGITHFGTSARYIQALQDLNLGISTVLGTSFEQLKCILVTGSPSFERNFHYIAENLGSHVRYISMSGGTDINGCWALGCPLKPIQPPQLQCRGLGMRVEVWNDNQQPVTGEFGELVCLNHVPCMPLFFWNDNLEKRRYYNSYFEKFGSMVWCHGDYAMLTEECGLIIAGRSDATLNPGGVRIGSSDIYSALESISEVVDSMVVGQAWGGDERVILLLVLSQPLDESLAKTIRTHIRTTLSPRHVPAKIAQVQELPYTFNMKKVEVAVKRLLNRQPISNRDSIQNPSSLDAIQSISTLWEP